MTRVLATGVFNILHPGHILFLKEAKKLGDELVVIVSSDKIASKAKKGFILPEAQRAEVVSALKFVDKVFIGDGTDKTKLLPVIKPDVIAIGHDQNIDEFSLREELVALGIAAKIIRIKPKLEGSFASSSKIAEKIKSS